MNQKITQSRLFIASLFLVCFALNTQAATITGTITYEGKVPKLRDIKMDADPICLTHNDGTAAKPQTITLNDEKQMKNVFVHVSQGVSKKNYPTPTEPLVLDQKGCMYDPAVFGVMINQPIKILNPDGTLHNVHALPKKNPEFNLAMPKFRKETTKSFAIPELMFPIKCDVHPWMITWGNVMDHPYFDVTDENGSFTIENLPAGEYVIEAIQQRLSPQKMKVTVTEDEKAEVNFVFSRPDGK